MNSKCDVMNQVPWFSDAFQICLIPLWATITVIGWITVIVFLCVCLGLLSSSYSLCWILLLVWFSAWSALIALHLPWWICIGFHTRSASHTNCVWSCLSVCVVLPLLILLTIVLVLLWCLVDRLWDLLLMVTLLFLVIGLTGVQDLVRWLAPAVGMLCLLIWGLPLLV